jgi:hypothetical protein
MTDVDQPVKNELNTLQWLMKTNLNLVGFIKTQQVSQCHLVARPSSIVL